jgi:hypothetical protein
LPPDQAQPVDAIAKEEIDEREKDTIPMDHFPGLVLGAGQQLGVGDQLPFSPAIPLCKMCAQMCAQQMPKTV